MAIPDKIKQLANDIRSKVYGREVRESLAKGIEEAGDIADQANTKSENAVYQVNNIQAQVNQLVVEGDSSVEAAQARVDAEGKSYPTLKARLDAKETEFSSQLAQARVDADGNTFTTLKERLDTKEQSFAAQLVENERNIARVENKIDRIKFFDFQEPIYIAHRGGANIFPENTLEAYESCLSMGVNVIELDVQQLADGALAVMHDTTMDRTTNRSGNVRDYSTMGFKRAKVDILPGWDDVHPPLFEEVLSRFGNNAIYIIESKDQKSAKKIADTLKRYRLEEYACIQSFSLEDLQRVADEGIPLMFLSNSANPQQVKNNNIDYIGVSTSASESYIQSCISAGLKVFVYTVNRRYERDYFLNLGVSGFFTDEPLYVQGKSPVLTKDPFAEQVFTHGMFSPPRNVDFDNGGKRGGFVAPNLFGWATADTTDYLRDFCLQGWAGVLPDSFTLTAKMTLQASVQGEYWGSIAFCTQKDIWNDSNLSDLSEGYHVLLREDGRLRLYRRDGTTVTLLNEITTPAWTQSQTANIEIVVTASQITVRRDTLSFTVNDTKYRGGYLHLGRRVSGVLFHDIYIT